MSLTLGKRCFHLRKLIQKNAVTWTNSCFYSVAPSYTFITPKGNPGEHTKNEIGLYYTLPNELGLGALFKGIMNEELKEECITFAETPILIRKPAIEIMQYLKNTDFNAPINKYLLYGKRGYGKTLTMYHIIHYAFTENWIVVHVPQIFKWLYTRAEVVESTTNEGYLDIPSLGSEWLQLFKNQNENLIKKLDLKIKNNYKWNIKESNLKGDSFLNLIDHGIVRMKYSCDVINALLAEIKLMSNSGICKTLVAIDGYSLIFQDKTGIRNSSKKFAQPEEITCISAFKNLAKPDWHNAAAILTSEKRPKSSEHTSDTLMGQLGRRGFEFLDPFIPIEVPPLSEKEMMSILTYYRSKKWLLHSKGDHELKFLCGGNALTLRQLCSPI